MSSAAGLVLHNLVAVDASFRAVLERIPRIAADTGTVLITGETGTGKELCARAIHHLSRRREHPFIAVDCGAFPETLLENELFGHVGGAYTDARGSQKGLARIAQGGVLFLDEIDSLSLASQAKLLRFLQEGTYKPLGDEQFCHSDVRIVAATNRDLLSLIRERRFRSDLYFRLSVLPVHLMPLRERPGDIGPLAEHFLEQLNRRSSGPPRRWAPGALSSMRAHDWPGNVRELQNVVQRAFVLADAAVTELSERELDLPVQCHDPLPGSHLESFRDAKARAMAAFERAFVESLLRLTKGNITEAARRAQKDRRAFGRLVKKLGIDSDLR
jgi:two-component system response regulator GlrR